MYSNVTNLTTPVTFHLIAQLLDVAKPTAGVALLLIGVIAVTGHVTSFPTSVAELLPLLFGLLAVPGNVTTPVAVVARILSLVTVPGHVSLVSTPITEQLLASSSSPATATRTTGIRAVLDPMSRAATSKALTVAAHLHYLDGYLAMSVFTPPSLRYKIGRAHV